MVLLITKKINIIKFIILTLIKEFNSLNSFVRNVVYPVVNLLKENVQPIFPFFYLCFRNRNNSVTV